MSHTVKLTLAGRDSLSIYVPTPFTVREIGAWRDSSARVDKEPRAVVYWGGQEFHVQETAEEILDIIQPFKSG